MVDREHRVARRRARYRRLIPQIRDVWVHERHEGISLTTFSVVTVALSLWLVYGILVESVAMIVANVFTLIVILAVLVGVRRLRKREALA